MDAEVRRGLEELETERAAGAQGQPEGILVEVAGLLEVGDEDRDRVQGRWLQDTSVGRAVACWTLRRIRASPGRLSGVSAKVSRKVASSIRSK